MFLYSLLPKTESSKPPRSNLILHFEVWDEVLRIGEYM